MRARVGRAPSTRVHGQADAAGQGLGAFPFMAVRRRHRDRMSGDPTLAVELRSTMDDLPGELLVKLAATK